MAAPIRETTRSNSGSEASPSEFQVTSSAICYGWAHNVAYGASQPIQSPKLFTTELTGTVSVTQGLVYNFAALNGTWKVHRIMQQDGTSSSAFFCCHADIVNQPVEEIRRITRLAGSPYESDSGSHKNAQATFDNHIIVINRYDWGIYDNRMKDEVSASQTVSNQLGGSRSIIVDYASASQMVPAIGLSEDGTDVTLLDNHGMAVGARLFLRDHEYEYGRFGLNEQRSAVVSFLFFSTNTDFETATLNDEHVKVTRTFEEMVTQDNLPCDGFELFQAYRIERVGEQSLQVPLHSRPQPTELRTFGDEKFLITTAEANARLAALNPSHGPGDIDRIPIIKAPFEHEVIRLLNVCLMTFLADVAAKLNSSATTQLTEERLHQLAQTEYGPGSNSQLKKLIGRYFRGEAESPLGADISDRLRAFLEGEGVQISEQLLSRVGFSLDFMLGELLELLNLAVIMHQRTLVTPGDLRSVIVNDAEIFEFMRFCQLLWPPLVVAPHNG